MLWIMLGTRGLGTITACDPITTSSFGARSNPATKPRFGAKSQKRSSALVQEEAKLRTKGAFTVYCS